MSKCKRLHSKKMWNPHTVDKCYSHVGNKPKKLDFIELILNFCHVQKWKDVETYSRALSTESILL